MWAITASTNAFSLGWIGRQKKRRRRSGKGRHRAARYRYRFSQVKKWRVSSEAAPHFKQAGDAVNFSLYPLACRVKML
jgi:hypothetical protein